MDSIDYFVCFNFKCYGLLCELVGIGSVFLVGVVVVWSIFLMWS